jgi:hypothetical protein
VPELVSERFGGAFPAAKDTARVDDDVMVVWFALDPDLSECDELGLHSQIVARRAHATAERLIAADRPETEDSGQTGLDCGG